MKKIWLIIGAIMITSLSGCSTGTAAETSIPVEQQSVYTLPIRKAEVSGVVKSIVGNEVSISLFIGGETADLPTVELTDEEKAAKKAAKQAENQAKLDAGETIVSNLNTELSGEVMDIIIPVGTKVVSKEVTGEFTELNIADLNKGTNVKIWLIEEEEGSVNIAETVQILTR